MIKEGFKVDKGHSPYCGCFGPLDSTFYAGVSEYRDKIGRKRKSGRYEWFQFKCHDGDCDAVVLIRSDVLNSFIKKGVAGYV
jgi:hypothetical protein